MEIKFGKPVQFEGKEHSSIKLDLEGLKGRDIMEVTRALQSEGWFAAIPAADPTYCLRLAQRVSGLPVEFFEELPASAFTKVVTEVTNFLLTSG